MRVWTESISTQEWFTSALWKSLEDDEELGDGLKSGNPETAREWWENTFAQSSTGVLVKVLQEDVGSKIDNAGPNVTEILFYGARVPEHERRRSKLPSPPLSSPSRQLLQQDADQSSVDDHETCSADFIQLFALPLSSDLLHQAIEPTTPPISPQTLPSDKFTQETTGTFLPQNFSQVKTDTAKEKKRQRVTDLFTKASQRRLKAPRIESSELTSLNRHEAIHRRGGKSKSFSERSLFSEGKQQNLSDQSSQSRRDLNNCSPLFLPDVSGRIYNDTSSKRSSLSRAVSMSNVASPVLTELEGLIARNKDVISRVVMAGLRLNGLQPRKNRSRSQRQSAVDSPSLVQKEDSVKEEKVDDISDESFKTMYHMVFRATIHTFVRCP